MSVSGVGYHRSTYACVTDQQLPCDDHTEVLFGTYCYSKLNIKATLL